MENLFLAVRGALVMLSALSLAACDAGESLNPFAESVQLPCPYVRVLSDAELYRRYAASKTPDAANLELEARIVSAEFSCEYENSDNPKSAMELDLSLVFAAQRGEAAVGDGERVPYFVALIGPGRDVVSKQTFEVLIPFPDPDQRLALTAPEEVSLRFPADGKIAPWEYSAVVGFQLTAEQLGRARQTEPASQNP